MLDVMLKLENISGQLEAYTRVNTELEKDVSVLFERTNEHAQRLAVTEKQIDALETSSNVTFNRTMTVLAILVSLGALVFTVLTRLMA